MSWSINTFQNKGSADQYHMTIWQGQFWGSLRLAIFLELAADQVLDFDLIAAQALAKNKDLGAPILGLAKSKYYVFS